MSTLQLHLICKDPRVDVKVNMGNGPATPTAGFAGWEVRERVRRKGMTTYVGKPPFQQDVPVLLDGYRENRSVERTLEQLLKLGDDVVFKAYGPIYYPGKNFVFGEDPEFGTGPAECARSRDGTLVRQALTLKLMEYVPATAVGRRRAKIGIGQAVPLTYRVRRGDTLIKIAQRLYHDWTRWKAIGRKNNIHDPHHEIRPGRVLDLPYIESGDVV